MKNSEEAIEKVWKALRESDAPPGMERRILARIDEYAAVRTRPWWRALRLSSSMALARADTRRLLVLGFTMASIFAAALVIPALHQAVHAPSERISQQKMRAALLASSRPATSEAIAKEAQLTPSRIRSLSPQRVHTHPPELVRQKDTEARSEMRSASFPAPPMPLTQQERLLLRIVHKDNPQELEALDPVARAAQQEKEKTDFTKFFEPPVIKPPTTANSSGV